MVIISASNLSQTAQIPWLVHICFSTLFSKNQTKYMVWHKYRPEYKVHQTALNQAKLLSCLKLISFNKLRIVSV